MKNNELKESQTVRTSPNEVAKLKAAEAVTVTQAAKAKDKDKKEPKARGESNEAAAERMLKEKASDEAILKHYTAVYKAKGITDKVFIERRKDIYMAIALKKANAKKAASAKK
jgi:hypothetical protein